ncbi:MAG: tRNA pseudouridine(13) synthase TruD [Marinobacter sp.]|nr:tRNA pseudouridine(13) synthase TruD [Marinobacter sp.]
MTGQGGWRLDWPGAHPRAGKACIRAVPEDFFVAEQLNWPDPEPITWTEGRVAGDGSALPGAGEHLCLLLEKRGDNTDYLARQLARLAGCRSSDIGYCGMKDRQAVTRQWFSVWRPGREQEDAALLDALQAEYPQWRLLAARRHTRKLRRGEHQYNHFRLRLTSVQGDTQAIEQALQLTATEGCPNYFGAQRFGHQGGNLDQVVGLAGKRVRGPSQRLGMLLSSARSWLFNEILAQRVVEGNWRHRLAGEPSAMDITGPLWGDGPGLADAEQGAMELALVEAQPKLLQVIRQNRMQHDRRPLILKPDTMRWLWEADGSLVLSFSLASGQFATAVLASVFELDMPEPQRIEK